MSDAPERRRLGGDDGSVEVRLCAGGPALVRGAATIRDDAGEDHAVTRPVVAVCLCGKTGRAPWCDGTHKAVQKAVQKADRRADHRAERPRRSA